MHHGYTKEISVHCRLSCAFFSECTVLQKKTVSRFLSDTGSSGIISKPLTASQTVSISHVVLRTVGYGFILRAACSVLACSYRYLWSKLRRLLHYENHAVGCGRVRSQIYFVERLEKVRSAYLWQLCLAMNRTWWVILNSHSAIQVDDVVISGVHCQEALLCV